MTGAFERLISPLDRPEFDATHWAERAHHWTPSSVLTQSLLELEALHDPGSLAASGHTDFKVLPKKDEPIVVSEPGEVGRLWAESESATVVARGTQFSTEAIHEYCDSLQASIGVPFRWAWPNLYFSHPGSGFTRHWDNHENFILGIAGVKRFLVAPNSFTKHPRFNADNMNPHREGPQDAVEAERLDPEPAGAMLVDVTPGTCLFIPRGWWHEAWAGDSSSVTLTWAIHAHSWEDLFTAAGQEIVGDDELRRTPLPLTTGSSDTPVDGVDAAQVGLWRAQAEMFSISTIRRDWAIGRRRHQEAQASPSSLLR